MALQGLAVELAGGGQQRVEGGVDRLPAAPTRAAFLAGHLQADALGQLLDRLGEFQVVVVHHEAQGVAASAAAEAIVELLVDRKSTRLNSSHVKISYAVFCL